MNSQTRSEQSQTKALAGLAAAALIVGLGSASFVAEKQVVPNGFTRALRIIQSLETVKRELPNLSLTKSATLV